MHNFLSFYSHSLMLPYISNQSEILTFYPFKENNKVIFCKSSFEEKPKVSQIIFAEKLRGKNFVASHQVCSGTNERFSFITLMSIFPVQKHQFSAYFFTGSHNNNV
jgi:hypothetical protein